MASGINTRKFIILSSEENEEESGLPTVFYSELGLAKILNSKVEEVYGIIIKDDKAFEKSKSEYKSKTFSNGWFFPDIVLGCEFVLTE